MKSIFEPETKSEVIDRIEKLGPENKALWGKMNVSQMMAHCANALDLAMGNIKPKRQFIGKLLGWLFKRSYTSEKPFAKNVPTIKGGEVVEEKKFEDEKYRLLERLEFIHSKGYSICTDHPHPILGKFSPEEWGKGMYKHLDHHLRQFGA